MFFLCKIICKLIPISVSWFFHSFYLIGTTESITYIINGLFTNQSKYFSTLKIKGRKNISTSVFMWEPILQLSCHLKQYVRRQILLSTHQKFQESFKHFMNFITAVFSSYTKNMFWVRSTKIFSVVKFITYFNLINFITPYIILCLISWIFHLQIPFDRILHLKLLFSFPP